MITIKTVKGENEYGAAQLHIAQNTPHTTMLLGVEMLIEALIDGTNLDIHTVLEDVKRIYIRDNGENYEKQK